MSTLCLAPILQQEEIAPEFFLLTFRAPEMAQAAQPGQFVHVRCGDTLDPLLRRPLSLHGIDRAAGTLTLLYRVVGRGTARLSRMQAGEVLDVMGPLGRGFCLLGNRNQPVDEALVVGGGIGVAPLLPLVEALRKQGSRVTVFLGARSANGLLRIEEFEKTGAQVEVATDDGSRGTVGNVVDLLENRLDLYGAETSSSSNVPQLKSICVFACGPAPMLRTTWKLCTARKVPLQVSLEERMGCGTGACLACVCKVKRLTGEVEDKVCVESLSSEVPSWKYARVCLEGPVFWGEEVLLDE